MPWAVSLSLGDDKLFFGPKHNIYALFMILFGLFDLSVKFVMWIVKQKIENKRNLFLKNDEIPGLTEMTLETMMPYGLLALHRRRVSS